MNLNDEYILPIPSIDQYYDEITANGNKACELLSNIMKIEENTFIKNEFEIMLLKYKKSVSKRCGILESVNNLRNLMLLLYEYKVSRNSFENEKYSLDLLKNEFMKLYEYLYIY